MLPLNKRMVNASKDASLMRLSSIQAEKNACGLGP